MTILATLQDASVHQTTSTVMTAIYSKDFTLDSDGDNYRIIISFSYTINNQNDTARVQINLDGTPYKPDSWKPAANNDAHTYSATMVAQLDSGLHNISVEAMSDGGSTVSLKDATLTVDKF